MPAAFAMRRAILRPRNPMPWLPSFDPHSDDSRQNGGIQTGIGKNVGDICAAGKCRAAKKPFRQKRQSRTAVQMNEPSNREEVIFEAALKLPVEQRADYLQKTCGDDAALRVRIEGLLKAYQDAGGFMEEPAARKTIMLSLSPSPDEKPGDRIGRYKLLQQIGEGGCGVVYMPSRKNRSAVASRSRSSSWAWTRKASSRDSRRNVRRWR